jgi:hypothetical protein
MELHDTLIGYRDETFATTVQSRPRWKLLRNAASQALAPSPTGNSAVIIAVTLTRRLSSSASGAEPTSEIVRVRKVVRPEGVIYLSPARADGPALARFAARPRSLWTASICPELITTLDPLAVMSA